MKEMGCSQSKQKVKLSLLKKMYVKAGVYEVSERELSNRIRKIKTCLNE